MRILTAFEDSNELAKALREYAANIKEGYSDASGLCYYLLESAVHIEGMYKQLHDLSGDCLIMPKALTAENGAKALLIGEFDEYITQTCDECDGSGADRDEWGEPTGEKCEVCEGSGEVQVPVTVSWTTIKEIYAKAVKALGREL